MGHLFRKARDYRFILLIPISICVAFVLLQCILQRYTKQSSRWSLTYLRSINGKWRGDPQNLRNERRSLWNKVSGKSLQYEDDTTREEDEDEDEMATYFGVIEGEGVAGGLMEEEEEEEKERLKYSPYIYHEEEEIQRNKSPVIQTEMKYVSYYQPYDNTQKSFKVCRYNMCSYAQNLSQADVIAFKAALIRDHGVPPFRRPKGQRWVMFTSDPASKNYNLQSPEIKSQFNATCTYRLDSDIKWQFGKLRKIQTPLKDYEKIYNSKEGLAAWFVSHCHTFGRREEYIHRMQTIPDFKIDIFGLCTNLSCGNYNHRKDDKTSCLPMLSEKYKFYLSFENALCEDYITEKFFKLFKNIHIIPVVRGGVDYGKHFPSDVFINAADFDSPESLAQYLVELGNDKERYLSMLRKKSSWVFTPGGEMKHCKLCEYAHTEKTTKYYPEIKQAFNGDYPHCWRPIDVI